MPNDLSFEIGSFYGSTTVEPVVDGRPLSSLISRFEAENALEPAGCYGGLIPSGFNYGPLDTYFMGEASSDYWRELHGIYLLSCGGCGFEGCWPLVGSVVASDAMVTWSHFRQPHRLQRDYSKFGPFVFVRAQYETALKELISGLN